MLLLLQVGVIIPQFRDSYSAKLLSD